MQVPRSKTRTMVALPPAPDLVQYSPIVIRVLFGRYRRLHRCDGHRWNITG